MKRKSCSPCHRHSHSLHKRVHMSPSHHAHPAPPRRALLIVDVQRDFCPPHGSLAVPEGETILPVIAQIRKQYHWDEVVLSQDWHPPQHCSFYETHKDKPQAALFSKFILDDGTEQILWPVHCVQGTEGATFHPQLKRQVTDHIVQKGTHPDVDSYSAFYDNLRRYRTHLTDLLHASHITHVYICGLALDYCVGYTALDSASEGFQTSVILDATKGVTPASSDAMLTRLRDAGISIIDSCDIPIIIPPPTPSLKSLPSQSQDDVLATPLTVSASTSPTILSPSLSPVSLSLSCSPYLSPRAIMMMGDPETISDSEGWCSSSSSQSSESSPNTPHRIISDLTLPRAVTTRSLVTRPRIS